MCCNCLSGVGGILPSCEPQVSSVCGRQFCCGRRLLRLVAVGRLRAVADLGCCDPVPDLGGPTLYEPKHSSKWIAPEECPTATLVTCDHLYRSHSPAPPSVDNVTSQRTVLEPDTTSRLPLLSSPLQPSIGALPASSCPPGRRVFAAVCALLLPILAPAAFAGKQQASHYHLML